MINKLCQKVLVAVRRCSSEHPVRSTFGPNCRCFWHFADIRHNTAHYTTIARYIVMLLTQKHSFAPRYNIYLFIKSTFRELFTIIDLRPLRLFKFSQTLRQRLTHVQHSPVQQPWYRCEVYADLTQSRGSLSRCFAVPKFQYSLRCYNEHSRFMQHTTISFIA